MCNKPYPHIACWQASLAGSLASVTSTPVSAAAFRGGRRCNLRRWTGGRTVGLGGRCPVNRGQEGVSGSERSWCGIAWKLTFKLEIEIFLYVEHIKESRNQRTNSWFHISIKSLALGTSNWYAHIATQFSWKLTCNISWLTKFNGLSKLVNTTKWSKLVQIIPQCFNLPKRLRMAQHVLSIISLYYNKCRLLYKKILNGQCNLNWSLI